MHTGTALEPFATTGVMHEHDGFSRDAAAAMTDAIWGHIEHRTTARRTDPASWTGVTLPSFTSLKRRQVFRPAFDNPKLRASLDGIFGEGGWMPSRSGVQVLFTFPNASTWTLPHRLWHTDWGFSPTRTTPAVKMFTCVDSVGVGGGGTLAVAGSAVLVARYGASLAADQRSGNTASWQRFMRTDPWLEQLAHPGTEPARTQALMSAPHDVDGVRLEIIEMAGEPGQHYITDIRTLHCIAPNALDTPRIMLAAMFSPVRDNEGRTTDAERVA